jgi:hypothetical protein
LNLSPSWPESAGPIIVCSIVKEPGGMLYHIGIHINQNDPACGWIMRMDEAGSLPNGWGNARAGYDGGENRKGAGMRILLAAAFWAAIVQPAQCGAVTDFLKLHDEPLGRGQTETEILGVQDGFLAANAYLTATLKQPPMYCQPETLNLTADQLVDMLRRGVKEQPALDDGDTAAALLAVMQRTFPCGQAVRPSGP